MTGRENPAVQSAYPPADRVEAYRRAAARPPVAAQVEQLSADLENLFLLSAKGDPALARGAALATAHAALKLAVTPVAGADDRRHRAQVLRSVVAPALDRSGFGHVGLLIEAALAHDGDPATVARGVETAQ